MSCPDCEAAGWNHDEVKARCLNSLYVTARVLCGFEDMTKAFHKRACNQVQKWILSGNNKILVLLPRGHLKTHMFTLGLSVWLLIRDSNTRTLSVSSSGRKASDNVGMMSALLKSDRFMHFFGDLVPEKPERWNQNEIELNRKGNFPEASFTGRGVKSRVTGGHFNVIIPDDIVDLQDADSDVTMPDAINWLKHSTPLFKEPLKGVMIVIGTRWGDDDPYGYIKANLPQFKVMEAGCFIDERCAEFGFGEVGEPLWKERFPAEALAEIRSLINDDYIFDCQYRNIAVSSELRRFKPPYPRYSWIEPGKLLAYEGREIEVSSLVRIMTADPSVGEKRDADDSAILVSGFERKSGNSYVLDAYAERIIMPTLIEKVMEMQRKWKPQIVGIEGVAANKYLWYPLKQAMVWGNQHFGITELKTGNIEKPKRIDALVPYFTNGQVILAKAGQEKLANQLTAWHPGAKKDDMVDALAYHIKYWRATLPHLSLVPTISDDDMDSITEQRPPIYGLAAGA